MSTEGTEASAIVVSVVIVVIFTGLVVVMRYCCVAGQEKSYEATTVSLRKPKKKIEWLLLDKR